MASKDEIIDTLLGVIIGGLGGGGRAPTGFGGENPFLDLPAGFRDALREDRARGKQARKKVKRAASASQKMYGRAFKRLAPKFKKKNGAWKKDGFKRCVRAAHRDCRAKHRRGR
jgi:hypothetical protein